MADQPGYQAQTYPLSEPLVYRIAALPMADAAACAKLRAVLKPEYFAEDLLFPYTAGFATVSSAYRSGGWAAVDALLAAEKARKLSAPQSVDG